MNVIDSVLADIRKHASIEYPKESCGVVIIVKGKQRYIPCNNISENEAQFILDPIDWAKAEDLGTPIIIVHSHPNESPNPSQADLLMCEHTNLPWLIVNWPTGIIKQFSPSGWKAPLVGRQFHHGVLDCLTLIQDYYKEVLNINLPQYAREDQWWTKGKNLYLDLYKDCGFKLVPDQKLETHDVLLMKMGSSVPNHGAIWLGDGNIIHHQASRLSSRDVYGGWYRKVTTHVLRYKDL